MSRSRATTARDVIGEWNRRARIRSTSMYGFSLVARVVQLRLLGLSTSKIADYLEGAHGFHLPTAAVLKMERWAADSVAPLYEALKAQVADQPVVHADETKFRFRGENGWLWVFSAPRGGLSIGLLRVAARTSCSRFSTGLEGRFADDGWVPYDVVRTAKHQFDLLHANRLARARGDSSIGSSLGPASGRRSEADGGGSAAEGVPRLRGRGSRAAAPLHRVVRAEPVRVPMGSAASSTPRCGG